jgi:polo-like kinase 1
MILNKNCFDFIYVRWENYTKESFENLVSHHSFASYPSDLKKKVVLIQHFKGYLDGAKFEPCLDQPHPLLVNEADREDWLYHELFLKKWKRAKKAILFWLSNKVI